MCVNQGRKRDLNQDVCVISMYLVRPEMEHSH